VWVGAWLLHPKVEDGTALRACDIETLRIMLGQDESNL
jgi:hypothetical protein